ncbi:pyridoxamine 5'-phosphate oxidase family protein [Actinoallomurus liliacearum]|uniref:Pyridoxamine 5'-phosphate oxidase family protein n=1 Tax=Actinoallomurus liliacearum TaxID=1080073 RepID=A0ABP8TNY0_9ACTN
MSQVMSVEEREAFLAGVRIGVLSVADDGGDRGPVTMPLWYTYRPGGELYFITGAHSRKAESIREAGRVSLCVHNDDPPYRYVTVEGPVTAVDEPAGETERAELAHRYLGQELGDRYLRSTSDEGLALFRVRPEHWCSADFGKRSE